VIVIARRREAAAWTRTRELMAYREFRDEHGVRWEAWDVQPTLPERRAGSDRRGAPRATGDRRTADQRRIALNIDMRRGWLAFESPVERRRLSPIPERWDDLSDRELRDVLANATPSRRPRRLLD
jgi:hypothetical protein